jgi:hypothetical protein
MMPFSLPPLVSSPRTQPGDLDPEEQHYQDIAVIQQRHRMTEARHRHQENQSDDGCHRVASASRARDWQLGEPLDDSPSRLLLLRQTAYSEEAAQ